MMIILSLVMLTGSHAFSPSSPPRLVSSSSSVLFSHHSDDRRNFLTKFVGGSVIAVIPQLSNAVDTEDFLKTGQVSMPMGVSGQAGKAKPVTGVILREGSDVSRDERSGDV